MQAPTLEVLLGVVAEAEAVGHGRKGAVYSAAAERLGISVKTLHRRLDELRMQPSRKRRADAGAHALGRDEALQLSAVVEETRRLTRTGTAPLDVVLKTLRARQPMWGCRVDKATGECVPLSASAIRRALRHYGCHPEQLAAPTPATRLASPHPNWCWQIDASLSRQYYLADDGTQVMDRREFYGGKPANFLRINDRRLWRYVVTDHASGYVYVFYVQGAESTANLLGALIHAMTPRPGEALHGLPVYLMTDPGPGVRSQAFQVFLRALGIQHLLAGEAREKGQVENGNALVNTHFEAMLRLQAPVASIEAMNRLAAEWCQWFNGCREHSRHGMTRRDGWLRITPEQLRPAPPVPVLRQLAHSEPKRCTVRDWRLRFGGQLWDVTGLPGVINGAKVEVVSNPLDKDTLRVLITGEDGRPAHFLAPRVDRDDWGFEAGAAVIGQDRRTAPQTSTDAVRKEIERLATQADTDAEAAARRKAKRLPFGGDIDPMRHIREEVAKLPPALPRAAAPIAIAAPAEVAPAVAVPVAPAYRPRNLSHVDMARGLRARIEARGGAWSGTHWARMVELWPEGASEEQLDDCAVQLLRGGLRVAGGAA